jgi:threonine dehydratase
MSAGRGHLAAITNVAQARVMSETPESIAAAARAASQRIETMIRRTPVVRAPELSNDVDGDVYLKLENLQFTGSFKLRGASNRLLTLSAEERERGCVVASSGNHGAAVAYALEKLGAPGIVFVPEHASAAKLGAIRRHGAEVRFFGTDGLDTEAHAREFAREQGMFYVSPYNDPEVVAGQGTCGIEIAEEIEGVDTVFVAVGGGGLISGVGSVLKVRDAGVRIYGCQPTASAVMAHSIAAGRILDLPSGPTLSDGTAGGIEPRSITFDLCQALVDDFILVDEPEIAAAMRDFRVRFGQTIEGAAGVAIAALRARPELAAGRKAALVICGGNVAQETLELIAGGDLGAGPAAVP